MVPQQQFVGEFFCPGYTVTKQYIDTEIPQIRLYHTRLTPPAPTHTLIIVHGFGEHASRFREVADFYAKRGCEVLMADLRGFGYSGGARGCAEVRELENDVIHLLGRARADLPVVLYGHSLGGLVVIKLLLERSQLRVSGCIVTSPLLGLSQHLKLGWFKRQLIYYLGDHLSDFIVNSKVNPTALTKDKKKMHTIFSDRLMLPFMSVKMAKHIFEAIQYAKANAKKFSAPICIIHGKQDTVTDPGLSSWFIKQCSSSKKKLLLVQNGYHELQHDREKDEMLNASWDFICNQTEDVSFGALNVKPISRPKRQRGLAPKIIFGLVVLLILITKVKKINLLKI